jgi:hypothetical protein
MMLRSTACCAAPALVLVLVLGLTSSLSAAAAPACDGTECRTPANGKPLNIMQFMREQAASARKAEPRPVTSRPVAKVQHPAHRTIAARPKPAKLPVEAAASFASQPESDAQVSDVQVSDVQVVASDEFNGIDRAAAAASAETVGTAAPTGPDVQLVDAEEFNDIDRKADDGKLRLADATTKKMPEQTQVHVEQANVSWLRWIWSALGSTFAALATAMHQLIGLR